MDVLYGSILWRVDCKLVLKGKMLNSKTTKRYFKYKLFNIR